MSHGYTRGRKRRIEKEKKIVKNLAFKNQVLNNLLSIPDIRYTVINLREVF